MPTCDICGARYVEKHYQTSCEVRQLANIGYSKAANVGFLKRNKLPFERISSNVAFAIEPWISASYVANWYMLHGNTEREFVSRIKNEVGFADKVVQFRSRATRPKGQQARSRSAAPSAFAAAKTLGIVAIENRWPSYHDAQRLGISYAAHSIVYEPDGSVWCCCYLNRHEQRGEVKRVYRGSQALYQLTDTERDPTFAARIRLNDPALAKLPYCRMRAVLAIDEYRTRVQK